MDPRDLTVPDNGTMIDPFGRNITYLRVSVTDRCDFRCTYCMAEDMTFLPKKDLLSLEELDRLCTVFIEKGVKKLRLTGGEPLVRKNIMHLVRQLSRHLASGALDELTLTTNGSQLARHAAELAACGVKRREADQLPATPAEFLARTLHQCCTAARPLTVVCEAVEVRLRTSGAVKLLLSSTWMS